MLNGTYEIVYVELAGYRGPVIVDAMIHNDVAWLGVQFSRRSSATMALKIEAPNIHK